MYNLAKLDWDIKMIKNSSEEIPTIRIVDCPACGKHRLRKYENADGTMSPVSEEAVDVREESRFLEVCGFCVIKYQKSDERFVMDNMDKLRKAMKATKMPDEETDHTDFSLN